MGETERMKVWWRKSPEEVDSRVMAVRAVKAVEGHLIGVNGGPEGTQEGSRYADVSEDAGGGSKRRIRRDMAYSRGERKEYRP